MHRQKCEVILFPPLTSPPHWAAAQLPMREELLDLKQKVNDALKHLSKPRAILNLQPTPTPIVLKKIKNRSTLFNQVLTKLIEMRCPPEQTSWLDEARTLAREANNRLDECFLAIEQLKILQTSEPAMYRYLDTARQASEQVYQDGRKLDRHLEQLLQKLPDKSEI